MSLRCTVGLHDYYFGWISVDHPDDIGKSWTEKRAIRTRICKRCGHKRIHRDDRWKLTDADKKKL